MNEIQDKQVEEAIDLALRLVPDRNSDDFNFDALPPVVQLLVLHRQFEAKVKAALDKYFQDKEPDE